MRPILPKLFAALLLACLAGAAWIFPFNKAALCIALTAYGALLWWRPHAWLAALPALLPVLDLAPWTGWFFLDELDLLLLATCMFGYARIGHDDRQAALPPFLRWSFALVLMATAVAAVIGLLPLAPLDANAFANYSSHYNSLRVVKGTLWALLLLPLLRRSAGPDLARLRTLFVPGMLAGLAAACVAVLWERATFPGLLNFASDYRPTAPFSAMHTGGAALDAYLAISFPFVAAWLAGERSHLKLALGLALLLLGSYAGMALFSRDIYLAYGTSGTILAALLLGRRARLGQLRADMVLAALAAVALAGAMLHQAFGSGGYRVLGSALVLLGAAVVLGGSPVRMRSNGLFAASALGLVALTALLVVLHDKGAYIAFIISAAVFGAGALGLLWPARASHAFAVAAGAFPALALGTVLVGWHWGGQGSLVDAAELAMLACAALAAARFVPRQPLRLNQDGLLATMFCMIVFATVIPVTSSYYMGERMATVGDDFAVRVRHWNEAVGMMDPGAAVSLFGMGLGRYPDVYTWNNTHGELPGAYSYETEGINTFLRLGAPQYAAGFGEVLRVLQHVSVKPGTRYRLSADLRSQKAAGGVAAALCERWLLYPQHCVNAPLRAGATGAGWRHVEADIDAGVLGGTGLLAPPVQLELAIDGAGALVDVDNLSLREAGGGPELIANGAFTQGHDRWFFSSDRNHFPFHIKNFVVNTFFEQGWFGIAAMTLLLLYLAFDLAARALRGENRAAVSVAALGGFLMIGAFDSLFDVARLTLVFFLVALAGGLHPAALAHKRRRVKNDAVHLEAQAEKSSNAP